MEADFLTFFYNVGELLTMTWPGRAALGFAVFALISRFARA